MKPAGRHLAAEDGVSLIEVMIGAFISVLIAGAVAVGLVQNNDSALATQRQTQLVAVLQNRIEWIHQLLSQDYTASGFATISLSQNPKAPESSLPTDPGNPNDFLVSYSAGYQTAAAKKPYESFLIEKNYNNSTQGVVSGATSEGEQLQVDPTNGKIPAEAFIDLTTGKEYALASEVPAGDAYAVVNTFVTLATEDVSQLPTSCNTGSSAASTAGDARRIIIAARFVPANSQPNADSTPQYATTLLTNPTPGSQCQHATGFKTGPLPIE